MTRITLKSALCQEFEDEMIATRKMLDCVPEDRFSWKPHAKSMTLGKLANHVAALPVVVPVIIQKRGGRPVEAATRAELLALFDKNTQAAREALAEVTDDQLSGNIFVLPAVEKPMWAALRGRGFMNHLLHHRGQLSVYLRLLDVPVPGMYGPSADEK